MQGFKEANTDYFEAKTSKFICARVMHTGLLWSQRLHIHWQVPQIRVGTRLQQEVREKKRQNTIVTFQLCTMNRIRAHTRTQIFFLHVSAWHPHTHRKATYIIQSGIFLLCFQVYGKEPKHTHTHREKPWRAPVQGKELWWNI